MDAVKTVRARGILMQNAVPAGKGAMMAVLGMSGEEIEQVIGRMEQVSVANYNCPGQIVITGETEAVKEAARAAEGSRGKAHRPFECQRPVPFSYAERSGRRAGKGAGYGPIYSASDPLRNQCDSGGRGRYCMYPEIVDRSR